MVTPMLIGSNRNRLDLYRVMSKNLLRIIWFFCYLIFQCRLLYYQFQMRDIGSGLLSPDAHMVWQSFRTSLAISCFNWKRKRIGGKKKRKAVHVDWETGPCLSLRFRYAYHLVRCKSVSSVVVSGVTLVRRDLQIVSRYQVSLRSILHISPRLRWRFPQVHRRVSYNCPHVVISVRWSKSSQFSSAHCLVNPSP